MCRHPHQPLRMAYHCFHLTPSTHIAPLLGMKVRVEG